MKVNLSLDGKDHTVRAEVNWNNENYVKKHLWTRAKTQEFPTMETLIGSAKMKLKKIRQHFWLGWVFKFCNASNQSKEREKNRTGKTGNC